MESLASSSHEFMIHHQATYDTPSSHNFDSQQVQSLQPVHRNLVHHPPAAEMDSSFAPGPTTELTVNHTVINGMVNCTNAHPVDFSQGFNCFPSPEPVIATPIHAPNPSATNMNLEHQLSAWPHDTLGNRTVSPIDHYVYDFASSADRISSEYYWVMHAADLGATNMNTSSGLGQQLILKLLKCVQSAEMDKFETEFPGSSLVQTAVTMHKLLSAILCLSKTQVYLRASDVEQTRIVVSFMLALCRRCLCELSDDLGSEAYSLIKQKSDYDGEPAGMKNDCSGASCVNPVWVAVGLYHRVLEALSSFELPPPIADIFDKVKIRSNMVLSNIYCVKEKIAHVFGSKLEKEKLEAEKVSFEQYIPPVSCRRYFNVAICFGPFDQSQPSTAIHRQTYQSSDVSYDAEFLLKESFEPPTRASPILESQPQDMMDGADYWENLEAELSQIHPFDEGLTDFEALENTLMGDWSKPSPTDSWSGTTLVNSVYCSLVGSY
ncbi:hypothetical protein KXW88_008624 [Aspergillus fumigatus]|nr:hypothetical protein KXW88_008624 [Aspergillus fumigatus]KAH2667223.1 hypothetical protein KXV32_006227 [Aspergillus fumigatus]